MKRKVCRLILAVINLILVSAFLIQAAELSHIEIKPGNLSTRVILIADTQVQVTGLSYISETPPVLSLELAKTRPVELPASMEPGSRLVRNIRMEPVGENLKILLELKDKVPFRLLVEEGKTVLEFNEFLRASSYQIEPAMTAMIRPENQISFADLSFKTELDKVSFLVGLTGQALVQTFALDNPSRLVVDLLNTNYSRSSQSYQVGRANVDRVRVAQFKTSDPCPITRLVFDLKDAGWYSLDTTSQGLRISFYSPDANILAQNTEQPVKKAEPIKTALANAIPAPEEQTTKKPAIKVEEKTETPPAANETPPVETKAEPEPKAAKPQAQAQAQQKDQFKPRVIQTVEDKYSGELISLKFKDADLRDVVLFLADFAGLNVIFDPEVRGNVTCNLQEVPWDQALEIVLRQNRMGKVIEGNVLRIAPISTLSREDEDLRRMKESKELAGPIQVKTITLSYSKARDVQSLLKSRLSKNGEIVIDERTNTLIISEVRDRMELLEKLIGVLDTPTPQVSIEARIVEATSTFIRNLGIQWGYKGVIDPFYGNQTAISFPNKILADGAMIPQGIVTKGIGGPLGGYAINLPAPAFNTAVGFSFANVLDTFRLDVALSALETSGNGRIISSPKVTTQNNQAAEIVQGRQIPVQTVANFTVTTRYVNAALELRATPQITAEGTIIMNIEIQNNAADFANLVNGIPPITTQSAKTTVMVPDGGTTVIGGIYRTEDSITRERVPYLHSIPVLGTLFRSFARTKQNRELLIFITPRIIK
ncbi:MAG: type IV pilus secretin PilQ [Candidatus Saccharicenans sp.]|uniref:type IV pilus secretin PilQ n=1 Tax=Candidatus Saccharicenans sp. TaxID=2819258 RepID=UPI00404A9E9A